MVSEYPRASEHASTEGSLKLTVDRNQAAQVLHVSGPVDLAGADELRASLDKALDAARPESQAVLIDLTDATTLSAAGLRVLLEAQQDARDVEIRIIATTNAVRWLATPDLPLAIYPTLEHALDHHASEQLDQLSERLRQREEQLESQPVIEQAKGMLMQDFGLDENEAFDLLATLSKDTNVKVHTLAARVVAELAGTATSATAIASLDALTALRGRLRDRHH